jgi:hypothetical protein
MAVIDTAENGRYFNPHDARIGGVLCEVCEEPLEWTESRDENGLVMTAVHCNKKYILKEGLDFCLIIEDHEESN